MRSAWLKAPSWGSGSRITMECSYRTNDVIDAMTLERYHHPYVGLSGNHVADNIKLSMYESYACS